MFGLIFPDFTIKVDKNVANKLLVHLPNICSDKDSNIINFQDEHDKKSIKLIVEMLSLNRLERRDILNILFSLNFIQTRRFLSELAFFGLISESDYSDWVLLHPNLYTIIDTKLEKSGPIMVSKHDVYFNNRNYIYRDNVGNNFTVYDCKNNKIIDIFISNFDKVLDSIKGLSDTTVGYMGNAIGPRFNSSPSGTIIIGIDDNCNITNFIIESNNKLWYYNESLDRLVQIENIKKIYDSFIEFDNDYYPLNISLGLTGIDRMGKIRESKKKLQSTCPFYYTGLSLNSSHNFFINYERNKLILKTFYFDNSPVTFKDILFNYTFENCAIIPAIFDDFIILAATRNNDVKMIFRVGL